MVMKQTYTDLNMKLEVICLCEVGGSSNSKTGRQYELTYSTLWIAVFCTEYGDSMFL
jgi:hypothetical protein